MIVIVVCLISTWCLLVAGVTAMLHHATRVPWWETVLLDLESIDVVVVDQTVGLSPSNVG